MACGGQFERECRKYTFEKFSPAIQSRLEVFEIIEGDFEVKPTKVESGGNSLKNTSAHGIEKCAGIKPAKIEGMKPFNLYDLLGILAPGTIVVVGLVTLFPAQAGFLSSKELSIGGLGVIAILAYVIGGLLAGIGNAIEKLFYKCCRGTPTDRLRDTAKGGIPQVELKQLGVRLTTEGIIASDEQIADMATVRWHGVMRQMHSFLDGRGRTGRIEIFNSQYGMYRGVSAAMFVLSVAAITAQGVTNAWPLIATFVFCGGLAVFRMNRFGRYYATELLRQFIQCPKNAAETVNSGSVSE